MKVPTGFVPASNPEVNPEQVSDEQFLASLEENFAKFPATLYTDGAGANYVVLTHCGQTLVLPVRTD